MRLHGCTARFHFGQNVQAAAQGISLLLAGGLIVGRILVGREEALFLLDVLSRNIVGIRVILIRLSCGTAAAFPQKIGLGFFLYFDP